MSKGCQRDCTSAAFMPHWPTPPPVESALAAFRTLGVDWRKSAPARTVFARRAGPWPRYGSRRWCARSAVKPKRKPMGSKGSLWGQVFWKPMGSGLSLSYFTRSPGSDLSSSHLKLFPSRYTLSPSASRIAASPGKHSHGFIITETGSGLSLTAQTAAGPTNAFNASAGVKICKLGRGFRLNKS